MCDRRRSRIRSECVRPTVCRSEGCRRRGRRVAVWRRSWPTGYDCRPSGTSPRDHRARAGAVVDWHSLLWSASASPLPAAIGGPHRSRGHPRPTETERAMPLDERKLDVLRAIVEDYVATQEPVGSRALVERHQLRVSAATVRNDMAALEDEGYLRQPHTSAGRVPTDRGYRLFVDKLSRIKPLSPAERRAIERFLIGAVDLDDVVHRTVRLLAQVTGQVAVVQYPSLSRSSVRHLELVPVSTTRLMLVMITDTGRVEQRNVELPGPTSPEQVAAMRTLINEKLGGRRLADTPLLI